MNDERRAADFWRRLALGLGLILFVGGGSWYGRSCMGRFDHHSDRIVNPSEPPKDCPELDAFNPALTALSVAELEKRMRRDALVPSFAVENQLRGMQAALAAYRPEKRDCMYKAMLVSTVATAKEMIRNMPGLWGLDQPSADTAARFRTADLTKPYTAAERDDLLAQVEELFIPALKADTEADHEYWRRLYYSLLLTCEATDGTLEKLGAHRPRDCLGLKPRPPK